MGQIDVEENTEEPQWPGPVRPWPADFPEVITQTDLPSLYAAARKDGEELRDLRSEAYREAKAGDAYAARLVIEAVIRTDLCLQIGDAYRGAIILSVHAEERAGRNKLAVVYARALGDIAVMDVDDSVVQTNRPQHTDASARARFARRPLFSGTITAGQTYLLVDDVVTSGSSLAALRHYTESRGGRVVAATTLAAAEARYGHFPTRLPVTQESLEAICAKFAADQIESIIQAYGVAPSLEHLTESEARVLRQFRSLDALRNSLAAGRQAVGGSG
jgi:hypothetical protein